MSARDEIGRGTAPADWTGRTPGSEGLIPRAPSSGVPENPDDALDRFSAEQRERTYGPGNDIEGLVAADRAADDINAGRGDEPFGNPDSPISPYPRTPAIVQPYTDALVNVRGTIAEWSNELANDIAVLRRASNLTLNPSLTEEADRLEMALRAIHILLTQSGTALHALENIE